MRGFFGFGLILQIAAIVHWSRRRPASYWLWIIIMFGGLGALAYFLVEGDFREVTHTFKGPSRRKRIRALQVLVLDNPSAGNYEELGELLLEERKWKEAREAYDRALAVRTDSIDPFYRRAIAEFELGEYEGVVRDLEHVVKVDPKYGYWNAYCLYAKSLAKTGRPQEAMESFEKLAEKSTASETMYEAAAFYADNGREGEAREIVQRLVARAVTMPAYQKRRDRPWIRKGKALERKMGKA
ncbi:MAG TPA: hypothetical protein VMU84_06070 [Thermoanaerobaculia bacterium]|nr:hypothetical protein [Thermoanaerobaculia bacterium]